MSLDTGADDNTDGGFVQLSGYLLTHPFLSANEKLVLAYLGFKARSFTDLRDCKPVKSKARRDDIQRDLSMKRQTADRIIRQLEALGLIVKVGGVGRAPVEFVLQPGPWPKLGDRPKKERTWREAAIFKLAGLKKRWLSAFKDTEVTLEAARQVLQGKEADVGLKMPSKPKEKTDKILKTPRKKLSTSKTIRSERADEELSTPLTNRGEELSTSDDLSESGVTNGLRSDFASGTQKPKKSLAGARGPIDIYRDSKHRSSIRESAGANRQVDPEASRLHPPTADADREPADVRGFPACIQPVNNTRRKLEQAEADARKLAKRKPKNPNLAVEQRYLTLVEEHYDIVLPKFNKGNKKKMKQVVERYGADVMLKAVDWLFDNWRVLKRNNPKFYGDDKFPPLRSLASYSLMDRYLPYIQKGEQMKDAGGFNWQHLTSDMEQGRQREAEIDVIEQQIGVKQ